MPESLRSPATEEIEADWTAFSGGPPIFAALGVFHPGDVEGVLFEDPDAGRRGLVT
ncbi:MAG: hypothetical protein M0R74_02865 [Dehalococcoidia bacterium]|nr:hypothetical protein [Dehalococcoidia bacterium]